MSDYRLTRHAHADLSDIWRYSAEKWGVAQADAYLTALAACFQHAADAPETGQDRKAFYPGMRSLRSGRHLVFYLADDAGIVIARVLHERRNMAAIRFSEG